MKLIMFLPLLLIVAFPMLYFGANSDNTQLCALGMVVFFAGMAGPILKRF